MTRTQVLPGTFEEWVERMRARVDDGDMDVWLPVTGPPGMGKSTLALYIAGLLDPTFHFDDVRERVAWRSGKFLGILEDLGPGKAAVLDEARGFWKREANTKENREAMHAVQEDRKWRQVKIVCGVDYSEFEGVFKNIRPDWRVVTTGRGRGEMKRSKRGREGSIKGWGTLFSFEWPDLSGTGVWQEYMSAARSHGFHGDQGTGQEVGEETPTLVKLFQRYGDDLEGLRETWNEKARLADGDS